MFHFVYHLCFSGEELHIGRADDVGDGGSMKHGKITSLEHHHVEPGQDQVDLSMCVRTQEINFVDYVIYLVTGVNSPYVNQCHG